MNRDRTKSVKVFSLFPGNKFKSNTFSIKILLQQSVFIDLFRLSTIVDKHVDNFVRNRAFPLKLFHNLKC